MTEGVKNTDTLIYRWSDRALSFSGTTPLAAHRHGAAELVVSIGEPFICNLANGQHVQSRCLLIPPNVEHRNEHADDICPILYLDAEGRDYRILSADMKSEHSVFNNLPFGRRLRKALQKIAQSTPDANTCADMLQAAFFGDNSPLSPNLDPRIETVLQLMNNDRAAAHPIGSMARAVKLSEGRLLHLFSEQVGIPFRRYRSWIRLRQVSRRHFEGCDLTSAAHEAGFSDSSHFIRTFHIFFGTKPTHFLSKKGNMKVFFG